MVKCVSHCRNIRIPDVMSIHKQRKRRESGKTTPVKKSTTLYPQDYWKSGYRHVDENNKMKSSSLSDFVPTSSYSLKNDPHFLRIESRVFFSI